MKKAASLSSASANVLHGSSFDSEDAGDMFQRNVGRLSTDYMALYSRRRLILFPRGVYNEDSASSLGSAGW
jgi:hypothetical protein